MRYGDPRAERMRELLDNLHKETRRISRTSPGVNARARCDGFLKHFIGAMYLDLKDESMFVDYFPEAIERFTDELGQKEVMEKLES